MGPPAKSLESCVAAWEKGDEKARAKSALSLGLAFDGKAAAAIDAALALANGNRRSSLLARADVLRVAAEAVASPHGIAVAHASGGRFDLHKISLCLAVVRGTHKGRKKKGEVVVGVAACWPDRPSPGRVWSELGPWQQDFSRNVEKATAWASKPAADRVCLDTVRKPAGDPEPGNDVPSGADLLGRILANPCDGVARLVYADWLIDQGDPRGQLIAVQCAIPGAKKAERKALLAEEKTLLRKHRATWTRPALQVAKECTMTRGFVSSVRATAAAFAHHGARLFETEPLEELVLSQPSGPGLRALAEAPHLARLSSFRFSSPLFVTTSSSLASLRFFLGSPHLAQVRALGLTVIFDPGIPDAERLFEGVSWPGIERLFIGVQGSREATASLASAHLPALRELVVPYAGKSLEVLAGAFPKALVSRKATT